jgi:hypothetical protein
MSRATLRDSRLSIIESRLCVPARVEPKLAFGELLSRVGLSDLDTVEVRSVSQVECVLDLAVDADIRHLGAEDVREDADFCVEGSASSSTEMRSGWMASRTVRRLPERLQEGCADGSIPSPPTLTAVVGCRAVVAAGGVGREGDAVGDGGRCLLRCLGRCHGGNCWERGC